MSRPIIHLAGCVAASLLSGFFLALAFPNHDTDWLVWIGLVPLIIALCGSRPGFSFFLSLITGVIFFVGICGWILASPGYRPLHHALAGLFLGLPFGLFGFIFAVISGKLGGGVALFAAPFAWVSIEYLRCNFFFLALPLGLLAHTQYLHPTLTQLSSFTGAYGLSFMIVMVNCAAAAVVSTFLYKLKNFRGSCPILPSRKAVFYLVFSTALFSSLVILYGKWELSKPIEGQAIKISVVQGNIPQEIKWERNYAKIIMRTYTDLTKQAAGDQPALIIWPEAATPNAINRDHRIFSQVKHIVETSKIPILLGSTMHQKFKGETPKDIRLTNSAFLVSPGKSGKNWQYDKIILVPFGEYLPMDGVVPWSWIKVPELGNYIPGKEWTVFDLADFRFSVTICWESIFPDLVSAFVRKGAQVIINITNECWYKDTAGPYQFLAATVFRAVENRVYVVRCANTGISCFIDPRGRIIDRVKDKDGQEIYVQGILTRPVIPNISNTVYTRLGDWPVWISLVCLILLLILAAVRKDPSVRGS
jgi:apolipoprotein N-acyltransferase